MLDNYFLAFVPLFVAVDAVGMVPIFLSMSEGMGIVDRARLLRHATLTALCVAVSFLFVGKMLFNLLGITIDDFLVAGGAILFIISIRDLTGFGRFAKLPGETLGVVPLAVPLIVGPAVLTSSLILWDSAGPMPTLFSLVTNILLCGIVLHSSEIVLRILGKTGTNALSKIANLLLAAIGVMLMRRGLVAIAAQF
jgi:multiple antibiotic resistance protein